MFPESRAKQVLKTIHFVTNSLWSVRNIRVFLRYAQTAPVLCAFVGYQLAWFLWPLSVFQSHIVFVGSMFGVGPKMTWHQLTNLGGFFLQIRMPLEAALKGLSDLWGIKLGRSLNQFPYTVPAKKQVHGTGHLWNLLCMVLTLACLSGGGAIGYEFRTYSSTCIESLFGL